MSNTSPLATAVSWLRGHDGDLRHAARVTISALIAFAVAQTLALPQGYWAVFTAILVTQASVGGSVKAAIDWFISTLGGGVYSALIATAIPKSSPVMLAVALALALAPLALLAGLRQTFRFAPVTCGIVILVAPVQHLSALASATNRLTEITIGGAIGLVVSLFVLPARAHGQVGETAARALAIYARLIPLLPKADRATLQPQITALHDDGLAALGKVAAAVDEAKRERASFLSNEPDPEPVSRTLIRLRADIVMLGRSTAEPFPAALDGRLRAPLVGVADAIAACFIDIGQSLAERRPAPSLVGVESAIAAYSRAVAAVREAQLTQGLATDLTGRVFAVGFSLEQLQHNLKDLADRTNERVRKSLRTPSDGQVSSG